MANLTRLTQRSSPISPVDSPRSVQGLTSGFYEQTPDRRYERQKEGLVKWQVAAQPPGELIAHTRDGHLVKDNDFYSDPQRDNSWNDPRKAGPFTWRKFHACQQAWPPKV